MSIEPHPHDDTVARAVEALTHFGGELDQHTANRLLGMWRWRDQLTPAEHAEVLEHFPAAPDNYPNRIVGPKRLPTGAFVLGDHMIGDDR